MPCSIMTSKGQVTIPKSVRDALGLRPGDRVRFTREADGRVVVGPERVDVRALAGMLKDKPRRPVVRQQASRRLQRVAGAGVG